jgi:hypothetical protein
MPRDKKVRTVGDTMDEIRTLEEEAAVYRQCASFLQMRYVPRDSADAQAQIPCNGAPVRTEIIRDLAYDFEEQAVELDKQARVMRGKAVDDE